MTLGRKTGGRDFVKGWKGGPGRPRKDWTVRVGQMFTQKELVNAIVKLLGMTKEEIKAHIEKPETPMVECIVSSVMYKSLAKGDMSQFDMVLNRCIAGVFS